MTDYRAYLDSRRVPRGPWCVAEIDGQRISIAEKRLAEEAAKARVPVKLRRVA